MHLAMSGSLIKILATAEFLDVNLLVLSQTDDRGGNGGSLENRRTELQAFVSANAKDTADGDIFARRQVTIIEVKFHAWFNAVLATAVYDDGVHSKSQSNTVQNGGGAREAD